MLSLLLVPMGVCAEEAPPTPQPGGRITAPEMIGVNPGPQPGDGELRELEAPGSVEPLNVPVPVSRNAPHQVEVSPTTGTTRPAVAAALGVPMRYQVSLEVSCGVQALGMALDFLGMAGDDEFLQRAGGVGGAIEQRAMAEGSQGGGSRDAAQPGIAGAIGDWRAA